jgi:hypothetical protein
VGDAHALTATHASVSFEWVIVAQREQDRALQTPRPSSRLRAEISSIKQGSSDIETLLADTEDAEPNIIKLKLMGTLLYTSVWIPASHLSFVCVHVSMTCRCHRAWGVSECKFVHVYVCMCDVCICRFGNANQNS